MTTERDIKNQIDTARDEGREDGEIRRSREIAKRMLANGLDIEMIVKCTGLDAQEIKDLTN